jgi:hypothetical protein
MQRAMLGKLSPDPFLADFTALPPVCAPLCSDQATRSRVLQELPTLDEIGIIVQQKGDKSWGVQNPGTDVADGPGATSTGLGSNKGKGKAVMPVRSDDEVSSDDDHPLPRRRFLRSGEHPVGGPSPTAQQAPAALTLPRAGSPAVTCLVAAPRTSDAANEAVAAAVKKVADAATGKKVAEDAAVAERVAGDKGDADVDVEEKVVSDAVMIEGTTTEVASQDVAEASPTPVVGARRTIVSVGGVSPLPPPSVGFVAPGSPGMLSDLVFVLPFFYAYFISPGFFIVQCVSL